MSAALRQDEYIVVTTIGGRSRSRVWNARKPLALGHPMRWVLEKTPGGEFCIRDIGSDAGELVSGGVRRFGAKELANRTAVPLPEIKSSKGKAIEATLMVEQVRPLPPAHQALDPRTQADSQTFVFAGVRKTVISSAAVQSGYAAYAGTRAAFTVHPTADGFRVKPLVDHLMLQPAKGAGVPLIRKESVNLSRDEVLNSTITIGQYWWKFGLVSNPGVIPLAAEQPFMTEDNSRFKKAASLALSLWLLFLLLCWVMPAAPKDEQKPEDTPVVKFELPKREAIAQKAQKKPDAEAKAAAEAAAAQAAAEAQKAADAKAAADAAAAAKEAAKEAQKKAAEQKLADRAAEKKAAEAAKQASGKSGSPSSKANVAEKTPKPKAPVVNKAPVVTESAAQVAAKARTKMLKDLLGGAAKGLTNDHKLESMVGKASTKGATSALGDLGSGDGSITAPTEVKPGFSGSGVKVGSLGGKDSANGSKSGSADGVGYAAGEHAGVAGQGGSFVAMNPNGASVEEGLTKEEVGAVIHSHLGEIRYCHEASMLANPTISGKLVLQFTINASGVVEVVSVASTTIPEAKLPECVVSKLCTWKFPHPKNGVKVSVAYPFLFKTLGRE